MAIRWPKKHPTASSSTQGKLDFDRPLPFTELCYRAEHFVNIGGDFSNLDHVMSGDTHRHRVGTPGYHLWDTHEWSPERFMITEKIHCGILTCLNRLDSDLLSVYMEDNRLGGSANLDWAYRPTLYSYYCEPCKTLFYMEKTLDSQNSRGWRTLFPISYCPPPHIIDGLEQLPAYRRIMGLDSSGPASMRFVREYDISENRMVNRMDVLYGYASLHDDVERPVRSGAALRAEARERRVCQDPRDAVNPGRHITGTAIAARHREAEEAIQRIAESARQNVMFAAGSQWNEEDLGYNPLTPPSREANIEFTSEELFGTWTGEDGQ